MHRHNFIYGQGGFEARIKQLVSWVMNPVKITCQFKFPETQSVKVKFLIYECGIH